jgi:uncharacterized membrane protein (DUF485 family)
VHALSMRHRHTEEKSWKTSWCNVSRPIPTITRWSRDGRIVMLIVYYGYILLIAFNRDLLATRIGSGVMTWGIPIGLFVIVFTVVITGIYVKRANGEFDELTARIRQKALQ